MIYFIFIYFPFLFYCPFFPASNAVLSKADEDAFFAFVKGPVAFEEFCTEKGVNNAESKQFLAQIYGTHLALLFNMRRYFHANANVQNFEELAMFFKCLDVLYQYLFHVSIGHTVTKPAFVYDEGNIFCDVVLEDLKMMARIAYECFHLEFGKDNNEWVEDMFSNNITVVELPQIVNEEDLDYIMPENNFEETHQTEEQQELAEARARFDENMEKMYQKAKENAEKYGETLLAFGNDGSSSTLASVSNAEEEIVSFNLFMCQVETAIEDEAFNVFVIGGSNYMEILGQFDETNHKRFIRKNEMHLGILSLMREHWHCANANFENQNEQQPFDQRSECDKFRQYVDIVYEYLFLVRNGGILTAVKPVFEINDTIVPFIEAVDALNKISILYFGWENEADNEDVAKSAKLNLLNWETVWHYSQSAGKPKFSLENVIAQMTVEARNEEQQPQQISADIYEDFTRHQFDQYIEAMMTKWVQMASNTREKIEAFDLKLRKIGDRLSEEKRMEKERQLEEKKRVYKKNYETLLMSPFFQVMWPTLIVE